MAQIRLDDEVYDRLKECADADDRTVGEEIHYLLDNRITLEEIHTLIFKKNCGENRKKEVESSQEDTSGRVEVKSYTQLKAEKARIEMEYAEKMNYCQDTDSIRELYAEMNRKLEPIQAQIDAFFNK